MQLDRIRTLPRRGRQRLRPAAMPIAFTALAAGGAWFFAGLIPGHNRPLIATAAAAAPLKLVDDAARGGDPDLPRGEARGLAAGIVEEQIRALARRLAQQEQGEPRSRDDRRARTSERR